jgi:hypothetical protein
VGGFKFKRYSMRLVYNSSCQYPSFLLSTRRVVPPHQFLPQAWRNCKTGETVYPSSKNVPPDFSKVISVKGHAQGKMSHIVSIVIECVQRCRCTSRICFQLIFYLQNHSVYVLPSISSPAVATKTSQTFFLVRLVCFLFIF